MERRSDTDQTRIVGRRVAVTFDDVPIQPTPPGNETLPGFEAMRSLTVKLLRGITVHSIPAVGFVNEKRLCQYDPASRSALLDLWLAAGLELGNHTFSHPAAESTSLAAYLDDVVRGEHLVRLLLQEKGMNLRYFRHPFLHTGPNLEFRRALEAFLRERGYTIAPVTIRHREWMFAVGYADAKMRGDTATMNRLAEAYLPYMNEVFEYFETFSLKMLGYEVRQILLLHVNELNVDYFDELIEMIKARGYTFISLEQALEDCAYRLPDNYAGPKGLSWLHRWALTMGLRPSPEPKEPELVSRLFASIAG